MSFFAQDRLSSLADRNTFREWEEKMDYLSPLEDDSYEKQIAATQKEHNLKDAIIIGEMKLDNKAVAIGVMDMRFMMASMGYCVGEKVTLLFERATKRKMPVIVFCCSGGARMQEGIISLMQMGKTSAAVVRHSKAGLLYISILTNPTMGGVLASYAMAADIILAEKGAMVGFAGSRVIEQNVGIKLPINYQTAEFQKEHGFVDAIVERCEMRDYLAKFLELHKYDKGIINILHRKREKPQDISMRSVKKYTPWEKIKLARSYTRPTSTEYINILFENFIQLSGDRVSGDDPAIIAGIAKFRGVPVTVIGQQKGKASLEQAIYYNWGMTSPSGYRKALRLMKQAEKFKRFIDTIGAACGEEAEEHGQGAVIATLLQEMSVLKVPILSIIISEGNSGGALALSISNEVWMFENAVYSIISPEGYASILWKDSSKAEEASEVMKLDAKDLYQYGVIDKIIFEKEPVTRYNTCLSELK